MKITEPPEQESVRGGFFSSPLLSLVLIGAAAYLIFSLGDLISYYFASKQPVELGDTQDLDYSKLGHNYLVTLTGITTNRAASATAGIFGLEKEYRYFLLAGARVFIQVSTNKDGTKIKAFRKMKFKGRLVNLKKTNDYQHVKNYFFKAYLYDLANKDYILLIHGQEPSNFWYFPLLCLPLAIIIVINLSLMIRFYLFRRRDKA